MKQDTQKQIDGLRAKIDELEKSLLEPEISGVRYKAKYDGKYWFVSSAGFVNNCTDDRSIADMYRYMSGNYHKTKELAASSLNRILAEQRIFDFIAKGNAEKGWVVDFSNGKQIKYFVASIELILAAKCTYLHHHKDLPYYGHIDVIQQSLIDLKADYMTVYGVKV